MNKIVAIACTCTVALCALAISSTFAQEKPASAPPAQVPAEPPAKAGPPTLADGRALLQAEEFEKAAETFHKIVKADPDNAQAWHLLGFSLHAAGNLTDALPCHLMAAEFEDSAPIASYNVACVYSLRKKTDKAFAWLEKARDLGFRNREHVEGDTDLDNIRSDPRFAKFLESLPEGGDGEERAVIEERAMP